MFYAKVKFFDPYKRNEIKGVEYTYKSFVPVKVGDLLVVDTKFGVALAQCTGHPDAIPDWPEDTWRTVIDIVDVAGWQEKEALRFVS